jgi:hypothetical protein
MHLAAKSKNFELDFTNNVSAPERMLYPSFHWKELFVHAPYIHPAMHAIFFSSLMKRYLFPYVYGFHLKSGLLGKISLQPFFHFFCEFGFRNYIFPGRNVS